MSSPDDGRQTLFGDGEWDEGSHFGGELPTKHTFRAVWKQPEDVDRILRQATSDGYCLNICAGRSDIGDVKVDAQPQARDVLPADMERLPFEEDTFDYALLDPPWNVSYFERQRPLFEAIRVVKPDGIVFFNARWLGDSQQTRLEPPLLIRADEPWGDISAVVAHRVDPDQQDLSQWGVGIDDVPTRPNPIQHVRCKNCHERVPTADCVRSDSLGIGEGDPFCDVNCMHEVEGAFGAPLTDVPGEDSPYPAFAAISGAQHGE